MNKPEITTQKLARTVTEIAGLMGDYSAKLLDSCEQYYDADEIPLLIWGLLFSLAGLFLLGSSFVIFAGTKGFPTYYSPVVIPMVVVSLFGLFLLWKTEFSASARKRKKRRTIRNIRQQSSSLKKIVDRASSLYENEKSRIDEFNYFFLDIKLSEAEVALRQAGGILQKIDGK